MNYKDSGQWQLGECAVRAVQNWRNAQGAYVLRADLIESGGAPSFVGPGGKVCVPDLLVASQGHSRWHEVKWKTAPDKYQKENKWRHGIDDYNWRQYLWVQNASSIPGVLDIVQLRPGPEALVEPMLLTAPFDWLCHRAKPHIGGGDLKVWWDVDDFEAYPLVDLDGTWSTIDIGPRVVHPWERSSKTGVAPRWVPPPPTLFDAG